VSHYLIIARLYQLKMPLRKTRCEKVWQNALLRCQEILGEEDYEIVMRFDSPEQLTNEIKTMENQCRNSIITRLLQRIQPHLSRLTTFVTLVLLSMESTSISTACIWGSIHLLVHVSRESLPVILLKIPYL
jgi:hypothetical protein